jgi:hypothetical protein
MEKPRTAILEYLVCLPIQIADVSMHASACRINPGYGRMIAVVFPREDDSRIHLLQKIFKSGHEDEADREFAYSTP